MLIMKLQIKCIIGKIVLSSRATSVNNFFASSLTEIVFQEESRLREIQLINYE